MNITVYAASSGQLPEVYTDAARELGSLLAQGNHTLVNGAGRDSWVLVPMLACAKAARR